MQKFKSYKDYLKSDVWAAKKAAAHERARKNTVSKNRFGICEICKYEPWKPGVIQVHHKNYPREWGTESVDDIICVCVRCHKKLHAQNKADAVS